MATVELYLAITGEDFDPDIITNRLGASPTSSHRKGDVLKYSKNATFNGWYFSSGKIEADRPDFYEISEKLLEPLIEKAKLILGLKHDLNLMITLQGAVYLSSTEGLPIIGFDPRVIRFLSTIEAGIDIDMVS